MQERDVALACIKAVFADADVKTKCVGSPMQIIITTPEGAKIYKGDQRQLYRKRGWPGACDPTPHRPRFAGPQSPRAPRGAGR